MQEALLAERVASEHGVGSGCTRNTRVHGVSGQAARRVVCQARSARVLLPSLSGLPGERATFGQACNAYSHARNALEIYTGFLGMGATPEFRRATRS